jgi:hypothetical protein
MKTLCVYCAKRSKSMDSVFIRPVTVRSRDRLQKTSELSKLADRIELNRSLAELSEACLSLSVITEQFTRMAADPRTPQRNIFHSNGALVT